MMKLKEQNQGELVDRDYIQLEINISICTQL